MNIGLKQGNALSFTLFNIALELLVKDVLDDIINLNLAKRRQIKLAAYEDDIII